MHGITFIQPLTLEIRKFVMRYAYEMTQKRTRPHFVYLHVYGGFHFPDSIRRVHRSVRPVDTRV